MKIDVLDVCCGSRKFWFDKNDQRALFIDRRSETIYAKDKNNPGGVRKIDVKPDMIADFRALPFEDNSFPLVVFDPPHIMENRCGHNSRMAQVYGTLSKTPGATTWLPDSKSVSGILKPSGTLVFKWAETNIGVSEVVLLAGHAPLFGNKMPKVSREHIG